MTDAPGAIARLDALAAKVDAFFERVRARHAAELACGPGCDDCCRRRLTVTAVEAARIERGLAALDEPARRATAERARSAGGDVCAALGPGGRCGIYEDRPLVCRSHGLPIRFAAEPAADRRALPVIDACFKNFTGEDLASLDADCVVDQATLSTLLAAVDAAFADEAGRPRGERVDLAGLLGRAG